MITCKECRWWEYESAFENFKSCSCKKIIYTGRIDFFRSHNNGDEFIFLDEDGIPVTFETGENFGCIHGELK